MNDIYRLFYNPSTEKPFVATRNQYLFRQSDPIDGIYCILEGQVKRIKEIWNIDENEMVSEGKPPVKKSEEDATS